VITNPILKEKNKIQKDLDKKANHDLKQYIEDSHRNVIDMAKKYGVIIKYEKIKGSYKHFFEHSGFINKVADK